MKRLLVAQIIIFALILNAERIEGQTYAIVAPDVVRPNTDYLVAISLYGLDDDQAQDVELHIRGRSQTSGQTIEIKHVTRVRLQCLISTFPQNLFCFTM